MATTLELLRAERESQAAEEARPPISTVTGARSLIVDEHPLPYVNATLEMCVLRMEDFEKFWRLELIDRDDEAQFEKIQEEYNGLDSSRRAKYVFQLAIWKNRNDNLNQLEYRQGFSYSFEEVHSLRLAYGNPVGSLQIHQRLLANALPAPQTNDVVLDQPQLNNENRVEAGLNGSSIVRVQETRAAPGDTAPQTPITGDDLSMSVTPAAKTSTKRKTRQDNSGGSSPKQQRKEHSEALLFDSP